MPTPLPDPTQVLLEPPDAGEVADLSRAIRSAGHGLIRFKQGFRSASCSRPSCPP